MISGSTAYSVSLRSLAELQSQELELLLLVSFVVADISAVCALPMPRRYMYKMSK